MRPLLSLVLFALALGACGSSSVTADASTDVAADAVALDAARDGAPTDDRLEPACDFPTTYTFGLDGGLVAFVDTSRIEPGRRFTWTRTDAGRSDAGTRTCSTMVAYCGTSDGGAVDTLSVINALNDADVIAAFADQSTTLYGTDPRILDGQVFAIRRADGRHFEIGRECSGGGGCRAIPAGLARLRTVLTDLTAQELARSECAGVRP